MTYRDILTARIREPWTQAEALKIADAVAAGDNPELAELISEHFADFRGEVSLRVILILLMRGAFVSAQEELLRTIENIAVSRWPQERIDDADREYAAEQASRGKHDRQDFEARR